MFLASPSNTLAALFIGGSWALWIGKILTQVDDRKYFRKIIKERGYHFTIDKAMKDMKSLGKGREFIVQLWEQSSQISDDIINDMIAKTGKSQNQLDSIFRDPSGPVDFHSTNRRMKDCYSPSEAGKKSELKYELSLDEISLASKAAGLTNNDLEEIKTYAETKAKDMEVFLESATPEEISKRLRDHSKQLRDGTSIGELDWGPYEDEKI